MVSSAEIVAIAAALALAAWVVHRQTAGGIGWVLVGCIVAGTVCGAVSKHGTLAAHAESHAELLAEVPKLERSADGFAGSDSCRACHPREYVTWHHSFHRTMTQLASPQAVVGDFDGKKLESGGYTYNLTHEGDEHFVEMVDFEWERRRVQMDLELGDMATRPRTKKRIVMTTGSHWMQTYWYASADGREVLNFPFVYLFEAERWVPREDVFLRPPDAEPLRQRWNDNCLGCHSTFGQPKPKKGGWDTAVAEIGIACEACHGPAREHVETRRDPMSRYVSYLEGDAPDPTIVNPARLDAARSAEVCGQCHSKSWFNDFNEFNEEGLEYRPGAELAKSKTIVLPKSNPDHPWLAKSMQMDPAFAEQFFWSDGMVRVSGREYNGMVESKCFAGGEMSCLSCHALHTDNPELHLHPEKGGDEGCLHCHEDYAADVPAHTHHAADSAGSSCLNCHMPYTSYGLLKGLRSHLVDVPTVQASVQTGRPNACNGCHLDKTLQWTAEQLASWWGIETPALSDDDRSVAASVKLLLEGDAGQRALTAWAYGWAPAREASGDDWQAPHLGVLLQDPYAAVRYIAARSLRTLPGFEDLAADFLADPSQRATDAAKVRARWQPAQQPASELALDEAEQTRRLGRRNDRPVDLKE
jgi:hypothetical protein